MVQKRAERGCKGEWNEDEKGRQPTHTRGESWQRIRPCSAFYHCSVGEYVCSISFLSPCINTCVCVSKSCCWLHAQFSSFAHFKSRPLLTLVSLGHWLLYKMKSPSQEQGMNLSMGKLLCKHEKVMWKTMACWVLFKTEVIEMACSRKWKLPITGCGHHIIRSSVSHSQELGEASDTCRFNSWHVSLFS